MPVSYRISVSPEDIAMHIKMATQAEAASTETETTSITGIVQFIDRPGFTELHLCSPSRIGKLHTVKWSLFRERYRCTGRTRLYETRYKY